jgi:hypothetical protein
MAGPAGWCCRGRRFGVDLGTPLIPGPSITAGPTAFAADLTATGGAEEASDERRHDNPRESADPAGGSGLRGIERWLAAFDGVLAVSSPPGGPTSVTMEIPCALSSPKTSSC